MKKMVGKKGDMNWFMLSFIAAIIIVVVIIIGVSGGLGSIFSIFEKIPDLEVNAQTCQVYANQELVNAYCYEFLKVKIGGKKQYMNCIYLEDYATFDKLTGGCTDSAKINTTAKALCETLRDKDIVNGKVCYDKGIVSNTVWNVSKSHLPA